MSNGELRPRQHAHGTQNRGGVAAHFAELASATKAEWRAPTMEP